MIPPRARPIGQVNLSYLLGLCALACALVITLVCVGNSGATLEVGAHSLAKTAPASAAHHLGGASTVDSSYGPLVSRGKPVYCYKSNAQVGGANAITSGKYGAWSFWGSPINELPTWCAIHIGAGPSRLMVVWYSDYDAFDYIQDTGRMPQNYTLLVSSNSTNGSDGDWRVVTTVTGNQARVRESVIPFAGEEWLKMVITKAPDHPSQSSLLVDQIDCFDVSSGTQDTALFQGDSLTALAYSQVSAIAPSFSDLAHKDDPALYPSMLNEGMGGWTSGSAVTHIDTWLALNPDIHYWLLGWGTNDALLRVDPAVFRSNIQTLVSKIEAAGHVPVLARIPAVRQTTPHDVRVNQRIQALNAEIDDVTQMNRLIIGPNLYSLFYAHQTTFYSKDGIHPNSVGEKAMNIAWYQAMRDVLRANR